MHLSIPEELNTTFQPAPELTRFVFEVFLSESSHLHNPEHQHLENAEILYLWAGTSATMKGRMIAGQAEIPNFKGNAWQKKRQEEQLTQWNRGDFPDFVITIDHDFFLSADEISRMALIEHELYHCAQATDQFGMPKFNNLTGKPTFTIRGHDVEEFTSVVRRYGTYSNDLKEMHNAMNAKPLIGQAQVTGLCGTCQREAA